MFRSSRTLFALLLVCCYTALALIFDDEPSAPPSLAFSPTSPTCKDTTPVRLEGDPAGPGPIMLNTNSLIRFKTCKKVVLHFSANGTQARGVYAHLIVSANGKTLLDTQVAKPREYSLLVPSPGWVLMAFINDLDAQGHDRNLSLDGIRLEAPP